MSKRENIKKLAVILLIFSIAFILRAESTNLSGIPDDEKSYFQDKNGLLYMYEMDSYYNYRLTRNYLDHGYLGDTIINGTDWDLHSYYPPGRAVNYPPLIVYVTAFFYKIINLFTTVPLITVCFWLPAFFGSLCVIPAYLFVRRLTNDFGGITAGILVSTTPIYFMRTVPGFFDTDMFNVLLPLLVVWFFVEAVYTENIKMRGFFVLSSAFFMLLFSISWVGWWYLFLVIVLSCLIYIIGCKLKEVGIKDFSYVFGAFLALSVILICISGGFSNFYEALLSPFELIRIGSQSPWPDVYISVAELGYPSLEDVIYGIGPTLFGLGIFGIFTQFFVLKRKHLHQRFLGRIDWFFYLLLVVWILTASYTLTKGIRFVTILSTPLIISAGITVGIGIECLSILKRKNLRKILSCCILLVIVTPSVFGAYTCSSVLTPGIGDDLWNCGEWIRDNTQGDTVIVSCWSYGHFFTAIADRPVTFDGGSQNTPREYWVDRAFSTSNESLSFGIFRMLSTSGDEAHLTLDKCTKNTKKSVEILNNVLGVDKQTAVFIMTSKYNLNTKEARNILKYTHPDNPHPFVLVTYDGMINKGYWTFHFGNWDFNKMEGGNYTYSVGSIRRSKGILNASNGVIMDLKSRDVKWNKKVPYCAVVIAKGKIEKRYLDKKSNFCVILLMDDEKAVVIDKRFLDSMFTKLVLEKSNTTYFKPIYKQKNVVVWKATAF